jgi:hypothetical protein
VLIPIPAPGWTGETLRYTVRPREKRAFATILDAAVLFPDRADATASLLRDGADVVFEMMAPLKHGRVEERVVHASGGMRLRHLSRKVFDVTGALVREENADFESKTHPLPACTYVDVSVPFLLGAQPFDDARRSLYAWICDRFVAKVYYERRGRPQKMTTGGVERDVIEVMMYPDLNDWVPLPAIITKLGKPFLPKYHMFYEREAPHRLVRFEGPHGPPGAPEVVMTLEGPA